MFRHLIGAALVVGLSTVAASASHNRGSVLIPSIDSNGNLTVNATSFWRPTAPDSVYSVSITGPGGTSFGGGMTDLGDNTSDSRFTRNEATYTTNISNGGAGLYTISWSSCCRVSGIQNHSSSGGANMGTQSTIYWDGQSAITPISFDIQNIQPNVPRNVAYSDNLDVTSPDGYSLSYDDSVLTVGLQTQAPGFTIDSTGQIEIPLANTQAYADNPSNDGADYAFSGQIIASDGGQQVATVQFDWLFDAVDEAANQTPQIQDVVINATVGDNINQIMTATDPNTGDIVTLSFLGFNGPGGAIAGSSFVQGTPGNPTDGTFSWDSTGAQVGTYIATFSATDGSQTDQGTLRINLTAAGPDPDTGVIPLPAGFVLLGSALAGLGALRRRRRS